MDWTEQVTHYAISDVGLKRSHNQDAFGSVMAPTREIWERRGHLFLVADGMGAHAVGELASELAVDTVQHLYPKLRDEKPETALENAIIEANQTIHEKGEKNLEFHGMGTTCTTLVLCPEGAMIGHVGDSRCYRIRGNRIDQLSFDHSLQWELARRQNVSPDQLTSVPSNIIVRSLGPEAEVKVDVGGAYPTEPGDRFLLCSDGLSGLVGDKEIWAAVAHLPVQEACRFLVDLANLRGGTDNITVVLVQVGSATAGNEERKVTPKVDSPMQKLKLLAKKTPMPWRFLMTGFLFFIIGHLVQGAGLPFKATLTVACLTFLILGFAGLILQRMRREKQPVVDDVDPTPIYRTSTCSLDASVIDEYLNVGTRLHEAATEENWKFNSQKYQVLREQGEQARQNGPLSEAFRCCCLAISTLYAAMPGRKQKLSGFDPQWSRSPSPES